jgi:hypothetical protein
MAKKFITTIDAAGVLIDSVEIGEALGFLSTDSTPINHNDTPYSATSDDELIRVDPSTSAVTINLPAAVDNLNIGIKNRTDSKANAIIINPDGTETIDGFDSISMKSRRGFMWLSGVTGIGWDIL